MANEANELLQAEQAIQGLLKELRNLKEQVGGYESAKKSLEQVRINLELLVEKTAVLAEKTHAATAKLNDIGTPEIISRIENMRSIFTPFAEQSEKGLNSLRRIALAGLSFSVLATLVAIVIVIKLFLR